MRFPYRRYHINPSDDFPDGILSRPEVPVQVIGPVATETLMALVDTGADNCILPRWTQEAIGAIIDESQRSTVSGIAGEELEVVPGEVELALYQGEQVFRWKARVEFASDENLDTAAILGHAGCLRYFLATFDGHARELDLVPTSDFPGRVPSPV